MVLPFLARKMLTFISFDKIKEVIVIGSKQAKRNKKGSQPLIKGIK